MKIYFVFFQRIRYIKKLLVLNYYDLLTVAEFEKKIIKKFAEYDKILDQLQYEINAKSSTGDNASASEEHDNSHSNDDPVNTCLHGPVVRIYNIVSFSFST